MASTSVLLVLAAVTVTPVFPETTDRLEKVRCVREQVTGSLVSTRKVCHTEREWRRISDSAQNEARRLLQPGVMDTKE